MSKGPHRTFKIKINFFLIIIIFQIALIMVSIPLLKAYLALSQEIELNCEAFDNALASISYSGWGLARIFIVSLLVLLFTLGNRILLNKRLSNKNDASTNNYGGTSRLFQVTSQAWQWILKNYHHHAASAMFLAIVNFWLFGVQGSLHSVVRNMMKLYEINMQVARSYVVEILDIAWMIGSLRLGLTIISIVYATIALLQRKSGCLLVNLCVVVMIGFLIFLRF